MLSRVGGRLVVSPLAFLATGLVDFSLFGVMYARWRLAQRREARARAGADPGPV